MSAYDLKQSNSKIHGITKREDHSNVFVSLGAFIVPVLLPFYRSGSTLFHHTGSAPSVSVKHVRGRGQRSRPPE